MMAPGRCLQLQYELQSIQGGELKLPPKSYVVYRSPTHTASRAGRVSGLQRSLARISSVGLFVVLALFLSRALSAKAAMPKSSLEIALAARDCAGVQAAIEEGADLNVPFADGLTPLCRASALGERRMMKILLNSRADVDAATGRNTALPEKGSAVADHVADAGFAALHWACRENRVECVRLLIEANATVDVRATDDVTPFMLACRAGHYECAKLLHKAGADVEAANARGGTAMVVACVMGEADTVRLLLSMGANADALTVAIDDTEQLFQCRPLVTACRYDRPKCVSLLLAAGVSIEAMTVAMTELAEFPNFLECARLVRKAIEKHERRAASGAGVGAGGRRAGSGAGATAPAEETAEARAEAEAKANAAMEALLAEAAAEPAAASKKSKKKSKAKKGAAMEELAVTAAAAAVPVERETSDGTAASKAREAEPAKVSQAVSQAKAVAKEKEEQEAQAKAEALAEAKAAAKAAALIRVHEPDDLGAQQITVASQAEPKLVVGKVAGGGTGDAGVAQVQGQVPDGVIEAKVTEGETTTSRPPSILSRSQRSSRDSATEQVALAEFDVYAPDEGNMFNYLSEYEQFKGGESSYVTAAERARAPSVVTPKAKRAGAVGEPAESEESHSPSSAECALSPDSRDSRLHQLAIDCDDDDDDARKSPAPRLSSPAPLFAASAPSTDDEYASRIRDYEQLDRIVNANVNADDEHGGFEQQLDLFLHRKKFTTSAMSFFLTKVRAPARQRCWPLPEEVMRRRKARRAPPPPGLLAEQSEEPSPEQPKRTSDPSPAPPERPEPQRPLDSARLVHAGAAADVEGSGGWVVVERHASRGRSNERRPRPPSPTRGGALLAEASSADARRAGVAAEAIPDRDSNFSSSCSSASPTAKQGLSEKRTLYSVKRRDSNAQLKLECRLEKELEAARERERALEAALRQRSEAFSELFVCPITHEPMQDPVSAADGQTYERRAIEEWLKKGDLNGGVPTSPLTGEPLKDKTLRPNFLARALRAGIA